MNNLKIIAALFCIASIYFFSCGDHCKLKVPCSENGACLEGLCYCSDGYEGESCDTLSSKKFVGHWKGQEIRYYNSASDTVLSDWTIQTVNTLTTVKITNASGNIFNLNLKGNKLTTTNEIVLDSLHIINSGYVSINTKKDTLRAAFDYKAVGNTAGFYSKSVLRKVQ